MNSGRLGALLFLTLAVLPCSSQQTGSAKTSGPCSPAVTGNSNKLTINCEGLSKEQGAKMLKVMNKILANQLDPDLVMAKLDEIFLEAGIAAQPLTSLSLDWQFTSSSPSLWQEMTKGQHDVKENAESTQGGVPRVPYEVEDYYDLFVPLLSYLSRIGDPPQPDGAASAQGNANAAVVVLMPLDESLNSILSFGNVGGATWNKDDAASHPPSGFEPASAPKAGARLADAKAAGASNYSIFWDADPATLAAAIQRVNPAILPTAKLPKVLRVAVIYGSGRLPFKQNDFSHSLAIDLWGKNEWARRPISPGPEFMKVKLNVTPNGSEANKRSYILKQVYELRLVDDFDDDFEGVGCKVFEFSAS